MVKRILAMVLAVTLVVTGFAPSILADAKPKVEVPVTVKVEGVAELKDGQEDFTLYVDASVDEEEALATISKAVREKVATKDAYDLAEVAVTLNPSWTKDAATTYEATVKTAAKPKMSYVLDENVANKADVMSVQFVSAGTKRDKLDELVMNYVKLLKFKEGFEFAGFDYLSDTPVTEIKEGQNLQVVIRTKKAETKKPETPDTEKVDLDAEAAKVIKGIEVAVNKDGKVVAQFPIIPEGLKANVTIYDADTNAMVTKTVLEGHKSITLPALKGNVNYKVVVSVTDGKNVSKELTVTKSLKSDDIMPKLNYAYVIGGRVVLNVTSPVGLDEKAPIVYRLKGETEFTPIGRNGGYGVNYEYYGKYDNYWQEADKWNNYFRGLEYDADKRYDKDDYMIDVEVPSVLQFIVIDKLGNKVPFQIEIKQDNTKLTKEAPKYFDELVKSAWDANAKKFKGNLIVINKGTTLNLFGIYEQDIVKTFKRFNSRNISYYVNNAEADKPFAYKFDEAGRYVVEVMNNANDDTFKYTVLVLDKNEHVKSVKVIKEAEAFSYNKFRGTDALDITSTKGKEGKPNQMFFEYDGEYYPIATELEFPKNATEVEIKVFEKASGRGLVATIKRGTAISTEENATGTLEANPMASFNDVPAQAWFSNYVLSAAKTGLIKGYPDGTFKPNNMISREEVLALVGRLVAAKGKYAGAVINNTVYNSTWGQTEINNAYSRINPAVLKGGMTEAITRGEVAYLFTNVINVNNLGNVTTMTFPDTISHEFGPYVHTLANKGIINGNDDGSYKPDLPISRAELAKILYVTFTKLY